MKGMISGTLTDSCIFPYISSVSSVTQLCLTLCDPVDCSMPGLPVHHQLLKLMSIELVMPSNYLILCHPLFLLASLVAQRLKRLPAMREMWV